MKIDWRGEITSVQPRFRLTRSFDQRYHSYLGFGLRIRGEINEREGEAWFGVGQGTHQKNRFRVGQVASGQAQPVADPFVDEVSHLPRSGNRIIESGDIGIVRAERGVEYRIASGTERLQGSCGGPLGFRLPRSRIDGAFSSEPYTST